VTRGRAHNGNSARPAGRAQSSGAVFRVLACGLDDLTDIAATEPSLRVAQAHLEAALHELAPRSGEGRQWLADRLEQALANGWSVTAARPLIDAARRTMLDNS